MRQRSIGAFALAWMLAAGARGDTVAAEGPYTIAFASFAPVNTAIFTADGDGSQARVLVRGAVMDANPAFSADGLWVFFTSRRHDSADLYRVRADGSGLERLTDAPGFDDQAAPSPDGRHVAFVSSRSGNADIWVLDLRTRAVRNLTASRGGDYRPAWSPDGAWIAFTSDRDSAGALEHTGARFAPLQRTQTYVMRADGSAARRVTSGTSVVGGASWSSDSRSIVAFEASAEHWQVLSRTFPAGGVVESQIVRFDVESGARTALTHGPGRKLTPQWLADGRVAYLASDTEERPRQPYRATDYWSETVRFTDGTKGPEGIFSSPQWSRDGRRLVFHRAIEETPPPVVSVASLDPMFRLIRTGTFPTFSPDGRRIACANGSFRVAGLGRRPPEGEMAAPTQLFVMDRDGRNRRLLYGDTDEGALGAAWSPLGDRIAFGIGLNQPRPGQYGPAWIATARPDGSELRRITADEPGNLHFPSWSPDGKRIVFRSAQLTSKGLTIVDVASGRTTLLTPDSGSDNLPAWSPDGKEILFTSRRDGDWEVYAIHPDGTGMRRLTASDGNDAHAAWSPDGTWIAFGSARGGFRDEGARGLGGQSATDIFVMRADGSDVRQLTDDAVEEGTPAFAPR
jgi:TolB protein